MKRGYATSISTQKRRVMFDRVPIFCAILRSLVFNDFSTSTGQYFPTNISGRQCREAFQIQEPITVTLHSTANLCQRNRSVYMVCHFASESFEHLRIV